MVVRMHVHNTNDVATFMHTFYLVKLLSHQYRSLAMLPNYVYIYIYIYIHIIAI